MKRKKFTIFLTALLMLIWGGEIWGQTTTYTKITTTAELVDGDYLIVYEDESFIFDGSLTTLDAANNYRTVSITDNTISTSDDYKFTILSITGGHSIKSASGYYIGQTTDGNGLKSSTTDVYANIITFEEDGTASIVSSSAHLRFNTNSSQDRFRYFKSTSYSNQKDICLYKKNSGGPTTYTVTYDANGGEGTVTDANSPYEADATVTVLGNGFTYGCHTFSNWNTAADGSGTNYNPSEIFTISANTTLYAQWTQDTYTITYNANGGTGTMEDGAKNCGEDYTIAKNGFTPQDGYAFVGWNTQSDGSGTAYAAGSTYSTDADLALYAQWSNVSYTVTFDPGSGTVTPASLSGVTINLSELTVTPPDGWTLYGWALEATDGATNSAPEIVSNPYSPTGDVTLYAVYMKEEEGSAMITPTAITGSADPYSYTISNDGYTLQANKNNGSTAPTYNAATSDARVYAKGTVVLSAPTNMTRIVFNLSEQGKKRLAPITASVGTIATQSSGDETVTWTGNASIVTFTVGEKAEYGSEGSSKAGQLCFNDINTASSTTTYNSNPGIGTVATPEFSVADGHIFTGNEGSVTITCETEGAAIQYSFDNENWNTYSAAVTVNAENHTIYAKATKTSYDPSATVSASYDFLTTLGAKALVYTNGENYFAITQSLEEYGNYSSNGLPGEEITVTDIEDVLTANVPDNNLVWTVQQLAVSGKYLFKTNSTEKYLQLASDFNIALGDMDATAILTATGDNPYIFSGNSLYLEYFANYSTFCATSNITYASSIYLMPYVIPTHYDISLTQPSEGTISATPSSAIEGATVTLTYDNGGSNYVVSSWTVIGDVSGNNIEVIDNTFTMPAENVTVSATLATTYTITVNNPAGATITASATSALPGTEITISYELEEYYTFNAWNVYQTEGEIPVTVEGNTFTMPAANVTVTASVTAPSTHTVTLMCNGTVLSSAPVVSLELPTPDAGNIPNGFTFIGWSTATVSDTDDEPVTMVASPYTPTEDVTLYAVFAIVDQSCDLTDIANLQQSDIVVITMKNSSNEYYSASNNNGTSNAPTAKIETVVGTKLTSDPGDDYKWNISIDNGSYIIYPNGTTERWLYCTNANNGVRVGTGDAKHFMISDGHFTTSETTSQRYLGVYNNADWRCYTSINDNIKDQELCIFKYTYSTTHYTTTVTIKDAQDIESDDTWTEPTAINGVINIKSGVTLTATAGLTNTNPANLIIEDGGQLIINNAGVQATVQKNISAYTNNEGTDNYYFIGSPVAENVAGQFAQGTYDLYKYDEATAHWKNYEAANFDIELGYGYLYANKEDRTVDMAGEVNVGTINITDLSYTTGSLAGFHLFGNPYTHDIYYREGFVLAEDYSGYYVPNAAGELVVKEMTEPVKAGQGFMMQIVEGGDEIEFNNTNAAPTAKRATKLTLQLTVGNGHFEDNAYLIVSDGYGLGKLSHFNENAPMLWIRNNDADYAIATMTEIPNSIPLCFKAGTTAKYTIRMKATGQYSYLHLIDRLTGDDIDMLIEGEYSFIGSPRDNAERFIVKFNNNSNSDTPENDIFAYQNGDELFVTGNGTIQVFDVTGRFVQSKEVHGNTSMSISSLPKGVYIFRLIGSEIKTQKIVVR